VTTVGRIKDDLRVWRLCRYLSADWRGRPKLDLAKIKAAEKFDGKFVVISNDDPLSAEDIARLQGWLDH
jgi:hypothetical protein